MVLEEMEICKGESESEKGKHKFLCEENERKLKYYSVFWKARLKHTNRMKQTETKIV